MIQDLRMQHFRSYDDASYEFEPGVNIIVGPNASGKTNLLEAILMLAHAKSYRARDRDLVHHQADWARLDAYMDGTSRTLKLEHAERTKKTLEIDGVIKKRVSLPDTVPVVLFEPTDLQLLSGSPERRRTFLDTLLSKTEPGYKRLLRIYERILAQRNALLKRGIRNANELFVWDLRLSEAGGKLIEARKQLVHTINNRLEGHYKSIANEDVTIVVAYESQVKDGDYGTKLLKLLEAHHSQDMAKGFTSIGPHRDDMNIEFNGRGVSETASRGEVRTLVLGLKILELTLIEEAREKKPLFLLDDVFSELDGARRKALTDFLKDHQTFITTTDADVVVEHFMDTAHVIALS